MPRFNYLESFVTQKTIRKQKTLCLSHFSHTHYRYPMNNVFKSFLQIHILRYMVERRETQTPKFYSSHNNDIE